MEFNIRGENFEVTPSLSEYVESKVTKLTKYFNETPDATAHVKMTVFQGVHKVEVTIPMKGLLLRAEDDHADMYSAIDAVLEKLERQVRKYKTKMNRKPRHRISKLADVNEGERVQEEEYEIVRTKRFSLKPMFEEEAIMQMDLLGHDFFVYTNVATNETDVVYRRKDGKYGVISTF
ncbi:ribosome-associated translation inhibitor RaiA (plasmid) [Rossellomorea sp. AcN35-11]|nr:ribosome-associated translation inhibitor RaiA [Rossellomorea sp. AcN35-11]